MKRRKKRNKPMGGMPLSGSVTVEVDAQSRVLSVTGLVLPRAKKKACVAIESLANTPQRRFPAIFKFLGK